MSAIAVNPCVSLDAARNFLGGLDDLVGLYPRADDLGWREWAATITEDDERAAIYHACADHGADSCLWFVDRLCWTYNPREDIKHLPFILWPVQEKVVRELFYAIQDGHDVLLDKSRDMGASWLCLAVFTWFWMFRPDSQFLLISRVQELVDKPGDPDSLMWKVDYLLSHIPAWIRPRVERVALHLVNRENHSTIRGSSTNVDVGRGGRRKAILLDEFAAVDNGVEILSATADTSPCRIFNSTPKGRGNAFADVRFSGKVKVLTLHWKDHPEKGAGATLKTDPNTGKSYWTSPWYESECNRRSSRKEIAENLDIDYLQSGDSFFDIDVCQRLRVSGQIRRGLQGAMAGALFKVGEKPMNLEWWGPLVMGRPPQDIDYVCFADLSYGKGASNSVCAFADHAGDVVGQLVDCHLDPRAFARECNRVRLWLGGEHPCIVGFESNGPGDDFGDECQILGWWTMLGNPKLDVAWKPDSGHRMGWHSTKQGKIDLLGGLRGAVASGAVLLHDEATVGEMEMYIIDAGGSVCSAGVSRLPEEARAAHGDRVIANAGLPLCLRLVEHPRIFTAQTVPTNCYAAYEVADAAQQNRR